MSAAIEDDRALPDLPPRRPRAWWLEEALADDPGEPCPPLGGEARADVLIVGGGFTGMWTALRLVEREPSLDVVLLEQDICGGGPSGRNGGFVNGWWAGLKSYVDVLGDHDAVALCEAGARSVVEIGEWCDRHAVDAWYVRAGDLGVASSPAQDGEWRSTIEAAERLGVLERFRVLTREEVRERVDSPVLGGGVWIDDCATVQPARLARGMRRVLLESGVRIFEGTPVRRFRAGRPVEAVTTGGRVVADQAVLAVNAWGQHWKAFRRTITLRGSYIVLTEPAPDRLEAINWTGGEALWDYRAAVHYVRTTPDGRIAFGCGGMQPDLARTIDPRFAYEGRFVERAALDLWRMFPGFRDVPLEAAWGGPIDVSGTHLPFFGTMPSGNVHYGLGYTGNGVGPAHLGGKILASLALGIRDEHTALPIVHRRPKLFPPEPIRSPGALIANRAILRKDLLEDEGRRVDPITQLVARLPRRLGYNLGP
jgi:glycine/D-amino acid oxidase-like deaminating enzyme